MSSPASGNPADIVLRSKRAIIRSKADATAGPHGVVFRTPVVHVNARPVLSHSPEDELVVGTTACGLELHAPGGLRLEGDLDLGQNDLRVPQLSGQAPAVAPVPGQPWIELRAELAEARASVRFLYLALADRLQQIEEVHALLKELAAKISELGAVDPTKLSPAPETAPYIDKSPWQVDDPCPDDGARGLVVPERGVPPGSKPPGPGGR
jgi:hypothetical protein